MTINVVVGTPAPSPTFPALPADSGSTYNIALALVRVVNGVTNFTKQDIIDATIDRNTFQGPLVMGTSSGVVTCKPADSVSDPIQGSLLGHNNTLGIGPRIPWPATGNRPGPYIPAGMVGSEELLVGLQLGNGLTKSHNSGDAIDCSRDWRRRVFIIFAQFLQHDTPLLAYDPSIGGGATGCPSSGATLAFGVDTTMLMGNSMALGGLADYRIADFRPANLANLNGGSSIQLRVGSLPGFLYVDYSGNPDGQLFLWIKASAPYPNLL